MLSGKWWLTPAGAYDVGTREHAHYALRDMLLYPRLPPVQWFGLGVPAAELDAALARGADPKAVEYLSNKARDPRLFAMKEYHWVRTARNVFNLWEFNEATAQTIRAAANYWQAQGNLGRYEMIDVEEFHNHDRYSISIEKLMAGGNPKILKNLAMSRVEVSAPVEKVYVPVTHSRSRPGSAWLYGTGDNPGLHEPGDPDEDEWDEEDDEVFRVKRKNPYPPDKPPPAEKLYKQNCTEIAVYATEHELPLPASEKDLFGSPGIGCQLKRSPWRGAFGVVFPTEDPGVVFKITADETEAKFVETVLQLYEEGFKPDGLVRYYAVAKLKQRHDGFPLFVLWREQAKSVGLDCEKAHQKPPAQLSPEDKFCFKLYDFLKEARVVVDAAYDYTEKFGKAKYWQWINKGMRNQKSLLHAYLKRMDAIANDMTAFDISRHVGRTLSDYLEEGIVLGDVHRGNVGVVQRGSKKMYVITDPGHVICLNKTVCAPDKIRLV